jgi:hypothetical protein
MTRTRWFGQVLEDMKKIGKHWQKIKKKKVWEEEIGNFVSLNLYEMETMLDRRRKFITEQNQFVKKHD